MKTNMILRNKKLISAMGLLLILILIPVFVHSPYYIDLMISFMISSVLAMTFLVMLRAGLVSLGVAVFYGIGAYAAAVLSTQYGLSFWLTVPLGTLITVAFAFILGLVLVKNTGFTFVILTSVIGMLFTVVVGNISYLGGYSGIANIPVPPPIHLPFLPAIEFGQLNKAPFYYLTMIIVIISVLIILAFNAAWTGRAWKALGSNYELAQSLGVNAYFYKLLSFVLASGLAGLVGTLHAHYQSSIIPSSFNMFTTIYIQVYAILGGIGYAIAGPILGTGIMTYIPELFRHIPEYTNIVVGIMLILLIMFLPEGLLSLFKRRPDITIFDRIGKLIVNLLNRHGAKKHDRT